MREKGKGKIQSKAEARQHICYGVNGSYKISSFHSESLIVNCFIWGYKIIYGV